MTTRYCPQSGNPCRNENCQRWERIAKDCGMKVSAGIMAIRELERMEMKKGEKG